MTQHFFLRPQGDDKTRKDPSQCWPQSRVTQAGTRCEVAQHNRPETEQAANRVTSGGRRKVGCGARRTQPSGLRGSGLGLQGPYTHAGQTKPGRWQLLALAVLMEADVEEEVTCVEEEEGPKAG